MCSPTGSPVPEKKTEGGVYLAGQAAHALADSLAAVVVVGAGAVLQAGGPALSQQVLDVPWILRQLQRAKQLHPGPS